MGILPHADPPSASRSAPSDPMSLARALRVTGIVSVAALGCQGRPPTVVRVQGTVIAIGSHVPVRGARIMVEWPKTLGGGKSEIKTDSAGHYAIGRNLRDPLPVCRGLTVSVTSKGYAPAYSHSDAECEGGVATFDFRMFPELQ